MRAERIIQASIFDMFAGHETGRELKAMSQWLDGHPTGLPVSITTSRIKPLIGVGWHLL